MSIHKQLETVKAQLANLQQDSHERLDALNVKMHASLMALAHTQFTELNNFEIGGVGESAFSCVGAPHAGASRADAGASRAVARVSTRRSTHANAVQQELVPTIEFSPENLQTAIAQNIPVIFRIGGDLPTADIQTALSKHPTAYRTTTNTRVRFDTVYNDRNGLHRIEEGPHEYPWKAGSAQQIIDLILP
ncbi:MAG: hypothetical protein JZU63_13735, partial [Rhodoferax sp.]|nr:hypothetical protein [Rhodoferax sp.]